MFERLARKEELEAGQTQRRDVFQEATDEEMRKLSGRCLETLLLTSPRRICWGETRRMGQ